MNAELIRMLAEEQMRERHRRAAAARRARAARHGRQRRPRLRLGAVLSQRVRRVVAPAPAKACSDSPL